MENGTYAQVLQQVDCEEGLWEERRIGRKRQPLEIIRPLVIRMRSLSFHESVVEDQYQKLLFVALSWKYHPQ